MKTVRSFAFPLIVVASALSIACSALEQPPSSEEGDIVGGKTAKQYPEAVLIDMFDGAQQVAACSGTLIAPAVVLTAGHCVHRWTSWRVTAPFAKGQSAWATRGATLDWTSNSEAVNPAMHDVGLLFLASPIDIASYPAIAKAPVADGAHVLHIGRIKDGSLSSSALFVSAPAGVQSAARDGFPYAYEATDVIESGDSGGAEVLPGASPHTIVAVSSGADGFVELLARADLVAGWIASQVAGHAGNGAAPPAAPACSHDPCKPGAHLKAACDPCVQKVCDADPFCCSKHWDDQCVNEAASCNASCGAGAQGCGGVSFAGECDGDTVVWCDGGLHQTSCAEAGLTCGYDSQSHVYDCI